MEEFSYLVGGKISLNLGGNLMFKSQVNVKKFLSRFETISDRWIKRKHQR